MAGIVSLVIIKTTITAPNYPITLLLTARMVSSQVMDSFANLAIIKSKEVAKKYLPMLTHPPVVIVGIAILAMQKEATSAVKISKMAIGLMMAQL
jgi:hypothetical protein